MMPALSRPSLAERLPPVRGRLTAHAPLRRHTWFRTGGPADMLFQPADTDDLAAFLAGLDPDIPLTIVGVGSNLLVRDGGVTGIVIILGKPFGQIAIDGNRVRAGAGAMDMHVADAAADAGVAGLEFLKGIPGTIGGAVAMNAGAYGGQISDCLQSVEIVDREGARRRIAATDLGFSYRRSALPADSVIVAADFIAEAGDAEQIRARMAEITAKRAETQPIGTRTGGSTFKNPDPVQSNDRSAWQLVEEAGCRGLAIGDAQISEKHCNFLINHGSARAADLEALGEQVRERVRDVTGVRLAWEIVRIGREEGA